MLNQKILKVIDKEILSSRSSHGKIPNDYFHCLALITEEIGEVSRAILELNRAKRNHGPISGLKQNLRDELTQVAALTFLLLQRIDDEGKN